MPPQTAIGQGKQNRDRTNRIQRFLTLPESCTSSLLQKNLTGLSTALNRTDLGPTVDTTNNFTCIAPSNQAFLMSGNPQLHANIYNLSQMVSYHTIDQPVYGDFLQNGQIYTSINNDQIVVTVNDSGTYFNGAKIIERDIMWVSTSRGCSTPGHSGKLDISIWNAAYHFIRMNNGILHVVDQVLQFIFFYFSNRSVISCELPLNLHSSRSWHPIMPPEPQPLPLPARQHQKLLHLRCSLIEGCFRPFLSSKRYYFRFSYSSFEPVSRVSFTIYFSCVYLFFSCTHQMKMARGTRNEVDKRKELLLTLNKSFGSTLQRVVSLFLQTNFGRHGLPIPGCER